MTDVSAQIKQLVEGSEVVVFMKGTRRMPQCGFSAQVVSILDSLLDDYQTINVLEDPALRQGIKDYSSWPTIPQVYLRGEFIGGCDIMRELHQTGELERQLGALAAPPQPTVHITPGAEAALLGALESDADRVRLEIDASYQHGLSIGPREPKDIEIEVGQLKLVLDSASARRADGVEIHFVKTPDGDAFRIDNPREPAKVRGVSVQELKSLLDAGEALELFDVRTPEEQAKASIGARLLDEAAQDHIMSLPRTTPLYFMCHLGGRSHTACEHFLAQGFSRVFNVVGGIDRWSQEVDETVPRY
ncbi:MAG: Grx4 family monothiol glutaredoxin [Polyangiaceae bacterium]|nr:Grx4 family monothiol glutaredoxin [Polyangiaceae bacterium]